MKYLSHFVYVLGMACCGCLMTACGGSISPTAAITKYHNSVLGQHPNVGEPSYVVVESFHDGQEDIYLAIVDWERQWWGSWYCFGMNEQGLTWVARGGGVDEASVLDIAGGVRVGHQGALIEVYGTTHMGNGSLYVFRLEQKNLKLLLETWAVRQGTSFGSTLHHGRLGSSWSDLNGDGVDDLTLHGKALIFDPENDKQDVPLRVEEVRRIFIFDSKMDTFVADVSASRGLLNEGVADE